METETLEEISSWKETINSAIKSLAEFKSYAITLGKSIPPLDEANPYPLFLPKNMAKRILENGPDSFLWKQYIPSNLEFGNHDSGLLDPIGDQVNFVAPQLIHRYKNRVLFLPTSSCPVQCRYCFRKNELHNQEFKQEFLAPSFSKTLDYLLGNKKIEEVIFTGGDPLILSNEKIDSFLNHFSPLSHIKFIRFHTRFPSTIPQRIDDGFMQLIHKWSKRFTFSLMIHTNHVTEWYSHLHYEALHNLSQLPMHIGSQTVLLKEHTYDDLVALFKFLIQNRVRPYYLHHPDKVRGAMHFYLSKTEGLLLYKKLRQDLPGWAIPHYVFDSELGEEKKLVFSK